MNTPKKFWIVLIGAILTMAIIACSCSSLTPLVTTPSTPTNTVLANPLPLPSGYTSLPYYDDFNDPNSGWSVYDTDSDASGYGNGYYYVISKTTDFSTYGDAGILLTDMVIDVDATPASVPDNSYFSQNVGCRIQDNDDGYLFELSGDGYYAVGYYTGGGENYTSLLSGDSEWLFSDAINQGLVTNHMTVTCDGTHLMLEVNGVVLFDGQDSTFREGNIGLGAATYDPNFTPAEIHFDNFSVVAP